jgi:hypothetical protein
MFLKPEYLILKWECLVLNWNIWMNKIEYLDYKLKNICYRYKMI